MNKGRRVNVRLVANQPSPEKAAIRSQIALMLAFATSMVLNSTGPL